MFDSGGEFGNIDIGAHGAQKFSIPRNWHEGFSIRCGYIVSTLAIADFGTGQSLRDNVAKIAVLTIVLTEPGFDAWVTVPS